MPGKYSREYKDVRGSLRFRPRPWRQSLLSFLTTVTTTAAFAFQPPWKNLQTLSPNINNINSGINCGVIINSIRRPCAASTGASGAWGPLLARVSGPGTLEAGLFMLGTSLRFHRQKQRQCQRERVFRLGRDGLLGTAHEEGGIRVPWGMLSAAVDAGAGIMAQNGEDRTSTGWGSSSPIETPSIEAEETLLSPVLIKVVGVGGGGGNAVDGMITTATRKLPGVEFLAMNTDTQSLTKSRAEVKITLGSGITRGLGAGGKPHVGKAAAKESLPEIEKALAGADMVFVTAGMGGGTGTGAAPIIAAAAKDLGCVTVAVVTEPFEFEGRQRSRQAAEGLAELKKCADTVLVVDNDRLLEIVPGKMTMSDAFLVADDILRQGVIGTSEIIVRPGLINVDFADVREVVKNSGTALIGVGTGTGKTRAEDAAVGAICSPLLDFPINQATGVIFNIVGGLDMSLTEVNTAAGVIEANVHPDANIIVGALVDERCGKQVSVTVLATGFATSELPGEAAGVNGGAGVRGSYPPSAEARSNLGEGASEVAENGGGYPSAPPSRPSFDRRVNKGDGKANGEAAPEKKRNIFRRIFDRRN